MKTKKTFLKMGIFAIFMGIFGLSFTSAISYKINVDRDATFEQTIKDKIMYIHFADNGNDFGGLLYFSNGSGNSLSERPEFHINISGDYSDSDEVDKRKKFYECRKQIKGFYYNAQRGERLRPLDEYTWSGWQLLSLYGEDFTGGIYTNCAEEGYQDAVDECNEIIGNHEAYNDCIKNANERYSADGNGYFGSLTHTYSGQEMVLVMGVNYTGAGAPYKGFISIESGSILAPTFVRLENKYPVGFVYDYNGGVGLAGCKFEEQNDQNMKILINEYYDNNNVDNGLMGIFEYNDDGKMKYKGSISGINCEPISQADTLMRVVIEGIVGISNSATKISNTAFSAWGNSSNSKMQQFATRDINRNSLMNYVRKKAELLCRGKWKNFSANFGDDNYHCGGNLPQLICYNGVGDAKCAADFLQGKTIIAKEGDLLISPDENYADGPYDIYVLSGNLIIKENDDRLYVFNESGYVMNDISTGDFNNAVSAASGHYKGGSGATVASFLKGNFIVNGNIKGDNEEENLKYKYFIYGKFSSRENIDDLEDTFARKCYNGSGSDGNYCPEYTGNSYWNASLVVLDQNFPSPVMN